VITIQEFKQVEMKVGKVLSVDDHPNADKLVVVQVDVGEQAPRTLVAGLKAYYSKEQLVGKLVVVVANLQPARLRGVESNGMVLAAQSGGDVVLLTLDKPAAPGAPVL